VTAPEATDERIKCRCGLLMLVMDDGALFCENCDWTQPQEAFGLVRNKTIYDIRFNMAWLRTMTEDYGTLPPGVDGDWEIDALGRGGE